MREKDAWRESEVRKEKDMGKGKISLTPQNRHLAGFMELEDEYLVIPPEIVVDGEKRKIGAIGSAAFASCRDLRTVVLLEGITKIGARAFERCGNLRDMEVPESLTEIGRNAFWGCESWRLFEFRSLLYQSVVESFAGALLFGGGAFHPESLQ